MATISVLTDAEKRLLEDYDPALREAGLGDKLDTIIASNNSLEARLAVAEGNLGASAHIADPTGGTTTDAEARTAINAILDILETSGLMAPAP